MTFHCSPSQKCFSCFITGPIFTVGHSSSTSTRTTFRFSRYCFKPDNDDDEARALNTLPDLCVVYTYHYFCLIINTKIYIILMLYIFIRNPIIIFFAYLHTYTHTHKNPTENITSSCVATTRSFVIPASSLFYFMLLKILVGCCNRGSLIF